MIDRLSLHQIDSVNILVRAHYMPAFSRLGPYDRSLIDTAAWGGRRQRRLFEYWAHEASLVPLELHPLLRWRMARADRGEAGWKGLRVFATERRAEAEAVLERIRKEGPCAASDFEERRSRQGWWEWTDTKHITTATRRGSFERVYDLTERVIPAKILALPMLDENEAHRALVERAALALGVATALELRDYFRLGAEEAKSAIEILVEAGILRPVEVPGWGRLAFLHRDAHLPRRLSARAASRPFRPARMGAVPRLPPLRLPLPDRDLYACRQAATRLLCPALPARQPACGAARPQGRPPGRGSPPEQQFRLQAAPPRRAIRARPINVKLPIDVEVGVRYSSDRPVTVVFRSIRRAVMAGQPD